MIGPRFTSLLAFAALAVSLSTGAVARPLLQQRFKIPDLPFDWPFEPVAYYNPGFNTSLVVGQAQALSAHSWEYGATAQATLEVKSRDLSVFAANAFPGGKIPSVPASTEALAYAAQHISLSGNTLSNGDGAAGDPAALGVSAIMLGQRDSRFLDAATRQAQHLLNDVPRNVNGAISQREDVAEQWADQIFMIPPFLAYYAVATANATLLSFVVDDIGRNRDILQLRGTGTKADGLWEHIIGPQSQTKGVWSTGNGWVALGMVRVLATMQNWSGSKDALQGQQAKLRGWLYEIFDGLNAVQRDSNGLLRNYLLGGSDGWNSKEPVWAGEAAGTAALAAAAYRLAVLDPSQAKRILPNARASRLALGKVVNAQTGRVSSAVDPLNWYSRNYVNYSPEAQAFTAMAGTAYNDCRNRGPCNQFNS